jgi:hypothetical protein
MEMAALLAILFHLASTFELIANTQRELKRAIYHLSERRANELAINNAFGGPGTALASHSRWAPADTKNTMNADDLARLSP